MRVSIRKVLLASAAIIAAQYPILSMATPVVNAGKRNPGISNISTVGKTTTVKQKSGVARISWQSIDTNRDEALVFDQPNSKSIVINDVTSGQATNFQGVLDANGRVVIRNNAGLTFTKDSRVNVGALTLTTARGFAQYHPGADYVADLDGKNRNLKGTYVARGYNDAPITLNGVINAAPNGYVVVLAKNINQGSTGIINAPRGRVGIQSGAGVYAVDLNNKGKIYGSFSSLDKGQINANGRINAQSGSVVIAAKAKNLTNGIVNFNGIVDSSSLLGAHSKTNKTGILPAGRTRIVAGEINIDGGKIDSSGSSGKTASLIEVKARKSLNAKNATLTTESSTGNNLISVSAANDLNYKGDINGTGTTKSYVVLNSGGNTNVDAGIQVGAGKTRIKSRGTTVLDGYIDAQGDNENALPSKVPSLNGGRIIITSIGDIIANGYVDSGSRKGTAGPVRIISSTGNITTKTKIAGNKIFISAKKNLHISDDGKDYITAYNGGYDTGLGNGGVISLKSGGNTVVDAFLIPANIKKGGNVNIVSAGNIDVNNEINTSSTEGKGGNVRLDSRKILYVNGPIDATGVNGGNISLRGKSAVNLGPDGSTDATGSNSNGKVVITRK